MQVAAGITVQNLVAATAKWTSLEEARADLQRFYDGASDTMRRIRAGAETMQVHSLSFVKPMFAYAHVESIWKSH